MSFSTTSELPGQSYECASAREATLKHAVNVLHVAQKNWRIHDKFKH